MKALLAMLIISFSSLSFAEGGKVQEQRPLLDGDGENVGVIIQIDKACETVVPQSGKAVYIICPDD